MIVFSAVLERKIYDVQRNHCLTEEDEKHDKNWVHRYIDITKRMSCFPFIFYLRINDAVKFWEVFVVLNFNIVFISCKRITFQIAVGYVQMCILHFYYSGSKCLIPAVCRCANKCILSFIAKLEYCTFLLCREREEKFSSYTYVGFFFFFHLGWKRPIRSSNPTTSLTLTEWKASQNN